MTNASLKSGSREICLPQSFEALNIRFKVTAQEEFVFREVRVLRKIKGCQRELAAMMRGSNMGILPYGLILLVIWGLPAH